VSGCRPTYALASPIITVIGDSRCRAGGMQFNIVPQGPARGQNPDTDTRVKMNPIQSSFQFV